MISNKHIKNYALIFYGLGIAGIGVLHFIFKGFMPVILPIPREATLNISAVTYAVGLVLFIAGLMLVLGKNPGKYGYILGVILLLFFALGHLPNRLMNQPLNVGRWTDALKILALASGAFIIANAHKKEIKDKNAFPYSRTASISKYGFALMLIVFGIDHFLYTAFVKTLVPAWIGAQLFWTYVAGIALIGSGVAIISKVKLGIISLLLGLMLLIWLIILHLPLAIPSTRADYGNQWVSVFECLAFSGIALQLYVENKRK